MLQSLANFLMKRHPWQKTMMMKRKHRHRHITINVTAHQQLIARKIAMPKIQVAHQFVFH